MTTEPFRSLGLAGIDWIEHFLVHGPGDVQGQPIELDDEFAGFIVKAYRLNPKTGERLVRRAFLSRAKGRNKSGTAAMIECFEAFGPCRFDHWAESGEVSYWGYEYEAGEPVGKPLSYVEALNVATEEGQAGNTYDAVYYMLHPDTCSPEFRAEFGKIDVGLGRINLPRKRGFIEPVTSADTSKDGGKSTFIVADETHLWVLPRLHRLHGIMTRNLLKRKVASGWMLETSTMYAEGENSVAEGTHAYAESSSRSKKYLLFDHRQAAESWNLDDRRERVKALREAYGPASEWMNLEAIADSWDDPQVTEAEFRRFWLNQPVSLEEAPKGVMPTWSVLASAAEHPAVAAVGIGMNSDRSWVSIGAAGEVQGQPFVWTMRRERNGPWVVRSMKRLQQRTGCAVLVDKKAEAQTFIEDLVAAGVRVEPCGLDEFVDACADFYDAVDGLALRHDDDADLNAAVAVADWRNVGDGRRAFSRRGGDIASLEGAALALYGAQHTTSVYQDRGLVIL
jgi:hypothetical protein